jgi:hypothetical protein
MNSFICPLALRTKNSFFFNASTSMRILIRILSHVVTSLVLTRKPAIASLALRSIHSLIATAPLCADWRHNESPCFIPTVE